MANKKLPAFTITEEGYITSEMKKKFEEIKARQDKKIVTLHKKEKNNGKNI